FGGLGATGPAGHVVLSSATARRADAGQAMTRPALGVTTHSLGLVTLTATGVLIVLGGLVTNTGAGLAVPDWPSTFGHNMFLFPWSQMIGGILYEHSHRLVGALVGLLTLVLSAALWREGGRPPRPGLAPRAARARPGV